MSLLNEQSIDEESIECTSPKKAILQRLYLQIFSISSLKLNQSHILEYCTDTEIISKIRV